MPWINNASTPQNGLIADGQSQDTMAAALKKRADTYSAQDPDEADPSTWVTPPDLNESDLDTSSKHLYSDFAQKTATEEGAKAGTAGTDRPTGVEAVYDENGHRSWRILHSNGPQP